MFLMHCRNNDLVEILDVNNLFDPRKKNVRGCFHAGEEMQDPEEFNKQDLMFMSGEPLPLCWRDEHYRDKGMYQAA